MSEVFGSVFWLIVALGVLVTFHEYGHYWVARRCGVKVLKFSVGFGRAIWQRTAADGTVWAVGMIPLGGYVKMLDEREADVDPQQLDEAFNRKPVGQRIAIVAAGPIFNLVFAVFAFWVMYLWGVQEPRLIVGEVTGIAAEAGLQVEDRIVAVDGTDTTTYTDTVLALVPAALDRDDVAIRVEDADGRIRSLDLALSELGPEFKEEDTLGEIGITPWRPVLPAIIETVSEGGPAELAGIQSGDLVVSIGGEEVPSWGWVPSLIRKYGEEGQTFSMVVQRGPEVLNFKVTPELQKEGSFGTRPMVGISPRDYEPDVRATIERAWVEVRMGPLEGLSAAVNKTWSLSATTLGILGRMVTGVASVRNISGPIGIAQFANSSAEGGFSTFLFFLGFISLSLGILNLLPIPLLDGGHLLYYLIELVKGSPVSDQVQVAGQYVGLVALFGLISLGIVNDILRLVG